MQGRSYRGLSNQVGVNVMDNKCLSEEDNKLKKIMGKNLRYLRYRTFKIERNKNNHIVHRQLTQSDLAKILGGITFQQVQKYEKGENMIPITKFIKISNFFNVPMKALCNEKLLSYPYTKSISENIIYELPQQHNI